MSMDKLFDGSDAHLLSESLEKAYAQASEAERKLAVARESIRNTYKMLLGEPRTALACMRAEDMLREALVQTGGDE